ncbi:tRNA (adenosine(37)-N6)-threonylcarbamoyltransferase complex dimerization subunit type 1 TsaB [Ensifer soli]|uniref:tRNA (adenosine(37)-N6)-threonylcarbamoyltransferase complex dimerization subunit type 1 TsaB n=1 Tax=Ciceribacter sp. sgz301302 TaxID=3342379 RepID=UPI0035B6BD4A
MRLLALDTSGPGCFAAVHDTERNRILAQHGAVIGRGHAEMLTGFIEAALADAGLTLSAIGRIAVTVGPGSFTGIRVGVAAARGFGVALGVPVVGVTTLAVLADMARQAQGARPVLAVMDPARAELYCQAFDPAGRPVSDAVLLPVEAARAAYSGFDGVITGSGAALMAGAASADGREPDIFDIAAVARLGALADPAEARPSPLYLRGPDARPQDGFAVARA